MTIRHVVSWKLGATDETECKAHAAGIKLRLESLPAVIPQIRFLQVGVNVVPANDFDVVLISDFDSVDDVETYQQHPAHLEVAAFIRSVVASRASVDFEV